MNQNDNHLRGSDAVKNKLWGHIWKTKSASLNQEVDLWWPTMGRNWTLLDCLNDYKKAKREKSIGQNSKIKVYRVILEEVYFPPTQTKEAE